MIGDHTPCFLLYLLISRRNTNYAKHIKSERVRHPLNAQNAIWTNGSATEQLNEHRKRQNKLGC